MTTPPARGSRCSTIRSTVTSERRGGQHRLLLHAGDPPQLNVALTVRLLRMDDRDVGGQRRYRDELLAGERARDALDARVLLEVGADVAAHQGTRHAGRTGGVAVGHPGVAVLLELDRPWPVVLDGIAQAVQRPDAGVAGVGEDQPAGGSRADHLVVQDVGSHADELELTTALAQHLVAGGKRDQMGEPLKRDRVAVAHELRHPLRQLDELSHLRPSQLEHYPKQGSRFRLPGSSPGLCGNHGMACRPCSTAR